MAPQYIILRQIIQGEICLSRILFDGITIVHNLERCAWLNCRLKLSFFFLERMYSWLPLNKVEFCKQTMGPSEAISYHLLKIKALSELFASK